MRRVFFGSPHYLCLSYFKWSKFCSYNRSFFTGKADINRAFHLGCCHSSLLCFNTVARNNYCNSWHNSHKSNVLNRLMRPPVWTNGNASVRTDNFYICIIVSNRRSYLFPVSARRKHGIGGNKRALSHGGHPRSNARKILFRHSHFHKSFWKFIFKKMHLGRFG